MSEYSNESITLTNWEICRYSFDEFKERIVVHTIETIEACTHEVAYPPRQAYMPLQPHKGEPAKKYPFPLDRSFKESPSFLHI